MQNFHYQLISNMKKLRINPLFTIIIILSPLIVYWLTLLLPTFDDWWYFTTPDFYFGEHFYDYLIPRWSYWRPWDCLIGYILSLKPSWFPTFNHIIIYCAHIGGTFIVYYIAKELKFKLFACNISALYYFISPGMLGTVLAIDSVNQAYSAFWGLLSTLCYIGVKKRNYNVILWLTFATIGTFAKENAIVFFVVPQIIAFVFKHITLRKAIKDTLWAFIIICIYFIIRLLLTTDVVEYFPAYFDNSLLLRIKFICVFLGLTWIPIDYISLAYPPTRNLLITFITLLFSMPFLITLFANKKKYWKNMQFACLVICMLLTALIHLTTLYSSMHTYASLGMAALIIGYMADKSERISMLRKMLPFFIISCIFIDWHHWQKSYESGLIGKRMAQDIINSTPKPVNNVYLIVVKDELPKYATFCVIPRDAFGNGKSVCYFNEYKWPKNIEILEIEENETYKIYSIANKAIQNNYEAVWLIRKDSATVIR